MALAAALNIPIWPAVSVRMGEPPRFGIRQPLGECRKELIRSYGIVSSLDGIPGLPTRLTHMIAVAKRRVVDEQCPIGRSGGLEQAQIVPSDVKG